MNIGEFRKDKNLVAQWDDMLRNHALLKLVLFDVMENGHPARFTVQADNGGDISPTMASIELGKTRGYSLYADRLRLLAIPQSEVSQMPETSYEPEKK